MATRSENDYMPNNMASKKSESRPTRQLDFYQAMADFQHMFPTMDEEIIEAVLRANNGAVDATIDQLLTMNIDNEEETDGPEAVADVTQKVGFHVCWMFVVLFCEDIILCITLEPPTCVVVVRSNPAEA